MNKKQNERQIREERIIILKGLIDAIFCGYVRKELLDRDPDFGMNLATAGQKKPVLSIMLHGNNKISLSINRPPTLADMREYRDIDIIKDKEFEDVGEYHLADPECITKIQDTIKKIRERFTFIINPMCSEHKSRLMLKYFILTQIRSSTDQYL